MDVGKILNPLGLTGQIEGGTAQGLGLALMEEVQLRDGRIANPSFTDYLIPTILDVSPVVSVAVEDPEPDVPYGLKGMGEVAHGRLDGGDRRRAAQCHGQTAQPGAGVTRRADRVAPRCRGGPPPAVPDVPGQQSVPFYFARGSGQQKLM